MSIADNLNRQGARTALALRVFGSGRVLSLTDADIDLVFGGLNHRSLPGVRFQTFERSADLAPDHLSVETALHTDGITLDDIAKGVFAEARAELWRVDAEDSANALLFSTGTIGQIASASGVVSLEYRSLVQRLARSAGRLFQKSCDARLGDDRCGVDLSNAPFHAAGIVSTHEGLAVTVTSDAEAQLFNLGTILVDSGSLAGLKRSVRVASREAAGLRLILWEAPPGQLVAGDALTLTAGCDKSFSTCAQRFENTRRFAGFPHVPGVDILTVQGRRSG